MSREIRISESQFDTLLKSGRFESYGEKIGEIGRIYLELGREEQLACEALADKYLALDKERDVRMDEDMVTETEIARVQAEENLVIANQIEPWFPPISGLTGKERTDYALAFLNYFTIRKKMH